MWKKLKKKKREENNKLIKNCVKYLKRKELSVLPKSYIESYLKNEKTIKDINILSEDDNAEDNEITRSTNKLRKKKSDSDILVKFNLSSSSTHFRKRKSGSLKKLNKIKGILRPGRRSISKTNSDLNNSRRVSFGWREESF